MIKWHSAVNLYRQLNVHIRFPVVLNTFFAVLSINSHDTTQTFRKHRSLLKSSMHCIGDTHFKGNAAFVHDEQRDVCKKIVDMHITKGKQRAARIAVSTDIRC